MVDLPGDGKIRVLLKFYLTREKKDGARKEAEVFFLVLPRWPLGAFLVVIDFLEVPI